jgi:site-specific DNA-methyltransferase (adenine-specific)
LVSEAQAGFALRGRNPDVLTCIANLSNDEVFTPPEFVNKMLDTLAEVWAADHEGAHIWADPTVSFLDPFTKSGVFLREITSRLTEGLGDEIPDLQERVNHILMKQVFGIATTYLTSLLARRSVYCSKWANGPHSIAKSFATEEGNIWFERVEHSWVGGTEWVLTADENGNQIKKSRNGKCMFCGAKQRDYDRGEALESHAYAFIHTDDIKARMGDLFGGDMLFDVVVGNPPYQLGQSGGESVGSFAMPVYQKFVQAAQSLDPRYVVMVTPSRWFTGGRGLNDFRNEMLASHRLRVLVDFPNAADVFPGVNINGGASYFVWERDHDGDCDVETVTASGARSPAVRRPLDEFDIFVRWNEAVPILRRVRARNEAVFTPRVSTVQPFGMRTPFHGSEGKSQANPIKFYGSGRVTWVNKSALRLNVGWVDKWKVLLTAATDGNENYPLPIWDQRGPFISGPGEACSESYLVAYVATSEEEAKNVVTYMRTKFFRFLVSLRKPAQHNKSENFAFVPDLPMAEKWTDAELYERYEIASDEQVFIDEMIRTMDFTGVAPE